MSFTLNITAWIFVLKGFFFYYFEFIQYKHIQIIKIQDDVIASKTFYCFINIKKANRVIFPILFYNKKPLLKYNFLKCQFKHVYHE